MSFTILVQRRPHRKPSPYAYAEGMMCSHGRHDPQLEETNVKNEPLSLRRRRLMIAALATAAAPSQLLAAPFLAPAAITGYADGKMVISGRVLDKSGKPLF